MSPIQKALSQQTMNGPLEVQAVDVPVPGPGELLVKVHATSLNPIDWKLQRGLINLGQQYPLVLGIGCAGYVEAIGDGVEGFTVGDAV